MLQVDLKKEDGNGFVELINQHLGHIDTEQIHVHAYRNMFSKNESQPLLVSDLLQTKLFFLFLVHIRAKEPERN